MGIFDKAKNLLNEHADKVDGAIDQAGDLIDKKTGGTYATHVDKGQDFAKNRLAADNPDAVEPSHPAAPADPEPPVQDPGAR